MAGIMGAGAGAVLPAPASKENGGASHCSSHGLFAYAAGSSVVVIDVRSMQLVSVLPMPAPRSTPSSSAPYVTAVQWTPEGIARDLTNDGQSMHLRLAVGDRQGRIAIWDVGLGEVVTWLGVEQEKNRLGIQDVRWVFGHPWLILAIHGPSLVALWDPGSGRCLWKFDAAPEVLASMRCDPWDARQVCILGLRGLLLSVFINSPADGDVSVKQYPLGTIEERTTGGGTASGSDKDKGGKDGSGSSGSNSGSLSAGAPALASAPGVYVRCLFSERTKGLLYIMHSREIIVFDLHFFLPLGSTGMPRGCGKLLDLFAVVDDEILYCAHLDGKISVWRRKEARQVFSLCQMESLMPSLGTSVPAPSVLAVANCPVQLQVQKAKGSESNDAVPQLKLSSQSTVGEASPPGKTQLNPPSLQQDWRAEVPASEQTGSFCETTFLSISDDGRLWHWVMTAQVPETAPVQRLSEKGFPPAESTDVGEGTGQTRQDPSSIPNPDPIFKLELTGQLHLLASSITTLAVPVPSLLATTPGGNSAGAVSAPLVALATQGGTVDLVDPAANAITASFSVHNNSIVRGVRWLGNSRLVSFSYTEVKGKGGGYINKLMVTCVRSGQSKAFRVLLKPERAPMRALRTSPSGRYLLILFREAPAEVWAMTRTPQMLRSLALPFTVMEWALPAAPRASSSSGGTTSGRRISLAYRERPTIASTVAAANAPSSPGDTAPDETAESFAFALVNGSLGVFELRGRRVRDFRPKAASTFVSAEVLVTAMAYRMPHVVMGDRLGNIRWWDVTTGLSSWFSTHQGGIRRIKFAPVSHGDQSRGRIAVLFNEHNFAIYDLDTQDPLANALVQPQLAGILVLELDWFPIRTDKREPLLLCVAGADGSFRLLEVHNTPTTLQKANQIARPPAVWQRYRPMPLCSPALFPPAHALALRMLLQQGVQPFWFDVSISSFGGEHGGRSPGTPKGDLRHFLLDSHLPILGETVVAEVFLKALDPYRKAGRLLDFDRASAYAAMCGQGCAQRFAFAAAHFGDYEEALFWLQLPKSLALLSSGSAGPTAFWTTTPVVSSEQNPQQETESPELYGSKNVHSGPALKGREAATRLTLGNLAVSTSLKLPLRFASTLPSEQGAVCTIARERISWHDKLVGDEAAQKRVHEYVSVGDFENAVTLLLATPPDNPHFYVDALQAVSLASAVSPALHELAVKVVAANMVATADGLAGTHLLCAVGRYQEACSQLQDAGRWVDAATLAAAHLSGTDHARVLERWGEHVLHIEYNLWRAVILFVGAGALSEALAALRNAQLPDAAAMFLLACHEAKIVARCSTAAKLKGPETFDGDRSGDGAGADLLDLPGDLNSQREDVRAVCEYYGQYQRLLAHLCTGVAPVID